MKKYQKTMKDLYTIDEVIEYVSDELGGLPVYFDESRAWSLFTYKVPKGNKSGARKYGAYRVYLGGGIRGTIRDNLTVKKWSDLFTEGLKRIEEIYNGDTTGLESWDLNTGVLL